VKYFCFFRVKASKINATEIYLNKGDILEIEVDRGDSWFDFYKKVGAKGWNWSIPFLRDSAFLKSFKDFPEENYMLLCGKIGNTIFPIGEKTEIIVDEHGELELFANDNKYLRWNNFGMIDVQIQVR